MCTADTSEEFSVWRNCNCLESFGCTGAIILPTLAFWNTKACKGLLLSLQTFRLEPHKHAHAHKVQERGKLFLDVWIDLMCFANKNDPSVLPVFVVSALFLNLLMSRMLDY